MELDATTIRLFLHLLAVSVWVGGQIVLVGLLPVLRRIGDDAPARVARQFNRVAWPAFGLAVVTGIWNLSEVGLGDRSTGYQVAILVKLALVALSGVAAWLHAVAERRVNVAIWGAVTGMASIAAMLFGAILVTSS